METKKELLVNTKEVITKNEKETKCICDSNTMYDRYYYDRYNYVG